MLLHDNVPAHSAIRVHQFLAQKMVVVLDRPPYDAAVPAALKGTRFEDVNAVKDRVNAVLRSTPQEVFSDCFRKLYERC